MKTQGDISPDVYGIGAFVVKPTRNLLVKDGVSYSLEPRIMDVLCELASKPREVVSRDALIKSVWNVEFGADESLTRAISILRKTFKKAGETQVFIQTIPKRGYRLAMDVIQTAQTPQSATQGLQSPIPTPALSKENAPVKMSAADISGYASATAAPKPKNNKISKVFLISIIPLVILAVLTSVWMKPDEAIGTSLSIEQYGRSVAVLSLADMSSESDMAYFADGMAEELLSALTQISDLRVAGRTSSFTYKGKNISIREIGSVLEVSHIIDGSVRKQGERLKITIRLNNTSNGAQIWSKTYNGTLTNAFSLQEEISQDIIVNLELLLGISVEPFIEIDQ